MTLPSFSSMADFRDVASVLPSSPTNIGKLNLCGCAKKLIDREISRSPFSNILQDQGAKIISFTACHTGKL